MTSSKTASARKSQVMIIMPSEVILDKFFSKLSPFVYEVMGILISRWFNNDPHNESANINIILLVLHTADFDLYQ